MKTVFKPLGLAAAVAAVTYAGAASAQTGSVSSRNVGDLGIIPYYTVQGGFATAIHIINTSGYTQVVKLRARRGVDSMDSLDFNLVLSPFDEWVGSMTMDSVSTGGDPAIKLTSNDTSCTAPAGVPTANGGQEWIMPSDGSVETLIDFREGAEEGYIEVIAMAQPVSESEPIAIAAKHVAGVPRDCGAVRSNFFRATPTTKGVHAPNLTAQTCATSVACENAPAAGLELNDYTDSADDALMVSWAVTDSNSGLEVGSNAVHIEGFAGEAMMSNQQVQLLGQYDPLGYLFPDLDGGSPNIGTRGLYDGEVRPLLGASSVMNDWSSRNTDSFAVATDWVVTMPGQYLMLDQQRYILSLQAEDADAAFLICNPTNCDYRDIPVGLNITYFDREEGEFTPEEGGLVVSPAINVTPDGIALPYEVNVIEWNVDADAILDSQYGVSFSPLFEEDRGWARLGVTPTALKNQAVWDYPADPNAEGTVTPVANVAVPIVGFAAWERNFPNNSAANYGRAIDHAYGSAAN